MIGITAPLRAAKNFNTSVFRGTIGLFYGWCRALLANLSCPRIVGGRESASTCDACDEDSCCAWRCVRPVRARLAELPGAADVAPLRVTSETTRCCNTSAAARRFWSVRAARSSDGYNTEESQTSLHRNMTHAYHFTFSSSPAAAVRAAEFSPPMLVVRFSPTPRPPDSAGPVLACALETRYPPQTS